MGPFRAATAAAERARRTQLLLLLAGPLREVREDALDQRRLLDAGDQGQPAPTPPAVCIDCSLEHMVDDSHHTNPR